MTQKTKAKLLKNEPLARYTSWRVGGEADRVYIPADLQDLTAFLTTVNKAEAVYFVGMGSNLLVRDGGVRGTVVVMRQALKTIKTDGEYIYAEAGVPCAKFARFSADQHQADAEFMAGIPGSIGGALAMNAGCYGGETWDIVHQVMTVDRYGKTHIRDASEFDATYRNVKMPVANEWFVGAWFKLTAGDAKTSLDKIKALVAKRSASQPLNYPSGGSTFRNPEGDYAARLIEASGLKGFQIGGAQVSTKHANFIVNVGDCRAQDIELLIQHMRKEVLAQQGVELQQEVKIIGEHA